MCDACQEEGEISAELRTNTFHFSAHCRNEFSCERACLQSVTVSQSSAGCSRVGKDQLIEYSFVQPVFHWKCQQVVGDSLINYSASIVRSIEKETGSDCRRHGRTGGKSMMTDK